MGAEMIVVDVGDDCDEGLQMRETGVTFISLGHQVAARAQARIAVGALQTPAYHKGGIRTALGQNAGDLDW